MVLTQRTLVAGGEEPPGRGLSATGFTRLGPDLNLAGRQYVLTKLDTLPYVESNYTKRFKFDAYDNPKLKTLREKYRLDEVVAPGKDEFDRQARPAPSSWLTGIAPPCAPTQGPVKRPEANRYTALADARASWVSSTVGQNSSSCLSATA